VIALLVGGAAVLLVGVPVLAWRRAGRRLSRLDGPAGHPSTASSVGAAAGQTRRSGTARLVVAAAAGLAVAGLIGRWWGVPVGVCTGLGVERLLRHREGGAAREARLRAVADLPLCADLLAAALRAGAPVDRAVSAVADALGGPLGDRLHRAGRSLRLGAGPAEAWGHLSDVAGADRLVAAALRSSASGAALAGALTRLADDLRADRTVAAEAAARRAGVLIVLPLGLCFLPAFVLAGLVPVVVAVLGDVL
jgi:Flp pilus assembly protein TadB